MTKVMKLSPAMRRAANILAKDGYVDAIDGITVGTIVALMRRGILREATPLSHSLSAGRHYPATTPEQVWDEAHTENEQRFLTPEFPAGTPEYEAYAAELRTELDKWVAGEAPYDAQPAPSLADDVAELRAALEPLAEIAPVYHHALAPMVDRIAAQVPVRATGPRGSVLTLHTCGAITYGEHEEVCLTCRRPGTWRALYVLPASA